MTLASPRGRSSGGRPTGPDEHGDVFQGGWQAVQNGDESLMGWLILLEDEEVAPFVA